MIGKAMSVFGERCLVGSDIGCVLGKSILKTCLGEQFKQLGWRSSLNAFHGYTHNYKCQLQNHPNRIPGVGLEDLETLERVFSRSNELASITRYASAFRRRVFIDEFFKQWDDEKYYNLGTMLLQNYKQAIDIITIEGTALEEALRSLGIHEGDMERWQEEEAEYFETIGEEPEWDIHAVAYAEDLQRLWKLECAPHSISF